MTHQEELEMFDSIMLNIPEPTRTTLEIYLKTETDYFSAPASTKYHESWEGGLLSHSLKVYFNFVTIAKAMKIKYKQEDAVIACLFHDLCKANFYNPVIKWKKNTENKWESYQGYEYDEKFVFGSHGGKSVYLLSQIIPVNPTVAVAINNHMGAFDNSNVGSAYEKSPFAWCLHAADEASTYLKEDFTPKTPEGCFSTLY